MRVKEMIKDIVEKNESEDMYKLNDMLDELICDLKERDHKLYHKYKMDLYKIAYGNVLSKEMAEEIIENMKPYHMKWTLEETKNIQSNYGLEKIRDIDFWIVMNTAYNDFKDIFDNDLDMYVKYTKAFINDEDAKDDKVFIYFSEIPKEA